MKFPWGYDISPLIHEGIAVFPGDQSFTRQVSLDTRKGDHLTLSSVTTTVHLGAHADSSLHYHSKGVGIDQRDPEIYVGWCEVIRLTGPAPESRRVGRAQFPNFAPKAPRVLVDTGSFPNPDTWRDDFLSFEPEWLEYLADHGVRLVGLDTPSVDPADSKALESHQVLFKRDIAVLEGLLLKDVPQGEYFLSALPLRIKDADASPVRAILMNKDFLKQRALV